MKKWRHLWDDFISFENIYHAAVKAQQRKRYKPETLMFNRNLEEHLHELRNELATRTWQPGTYRYFKISEPKERDIFAAPYRDRVVHHAVINIIEPLYEPTFYHHSYACRLNKGMHRAIDVADRWLKRHAWILKCDIRKFFHCIDHGILKDILHKKIDDDRFMELIHHIIDSAPDIPSPVIYYPGDDVFTLLERRKGIPIGNLTSQFFANLYLNELDTFVKQSLRAPSYIRYMDDFLLFHDNKEQLLRWRTDIWEFLQSLRLSLNEKKSMVFPRKNGVAFLGFHLTEQHRRLRQANIRRFLKRMHGFQRSFSHGEIELEDVGRSLAAWLGHAGHGDTSQLTRKLLYHLPFHRDGPSMRHTA